MIAARIAALRVQIAALRVQIAAGRDHSGELTRKAYALLQELDKLTE